MGSLVKFDKPAKVNNPVSTDSGSNLTRDFAIAAFVVLSINIADCRQWDIDTPSSEPHSMEMVESPMSRYDINIDAGLFDAKRQFYNRVHSFLKLRDNWDGYGAEPVNRQVFRNVIRVINQLAVKDLANWNFYPSVNGTILMTIKGKRLSTIDFGINRFSYYASQLKGPNFCEGMEDFDVSNIINKISQIEQYFGLA